MCPPHSGTPPGTVPGHGLVSPEPATGCVPSLPESALVLSSWSQQHLPASQQHVRGPLSRASASDTLVQNALCPVGPFFAEGLPWGRHCSVWAEYCVWETDRHTAIQYRQREMGSRVLGRKKKGCCDGVTLCQVTGPSLRELELLLIFCPIFRIFLNVFASFYTYSFVFKSASKTL